MATSVNRFEHRPNAIDRMGRTVVFEGEMLRHPVYTRFLHWMVGIFFSFWHCCPVSRSTCRGSSASSLPCLVAKP